MFNFVLAVLLAYLIAAFPTAYVIAKLNGKNIFELGSGNMGAMNSFRNLGKLAGTSVFFIDVLKGYAAISLANLLSSDSLLFALVAVIIGHVWSVFIGFRGGKALAAGFGALLVIRPLFAISIIFALIASIMVLGKKSNLAVAIIVIIYPLASIIYAVLNNSTELLQFSYALFAMSAIIAFKHIPGIKQELADSRNATEQKKDANQKQ